jgi:hypothetical protein
VAPWKNEKAAIEVWKPVWVIIHPTLSPTLRLKSFVFSPPVPEHGKNLRWLVGGVAEASESEIESVLSKKARMDTEGFRWPAAGAGPPNI